MKKTLLLLTFLAIFSFPTFAYTLSFESSVKLKLVCYLLSIPTIIGVGILLEKRIKQHRAKVSQQKKKLLVFVAAFVCSTVCFAITDGINWHHHENTPPIKSFAELTAVLIGISPVMIFLAFMFWAFEYRNRAYWIKVVFTVCDSTTQHAVQLLRVAHKKKKFRIFSEPEIPDSYIGPELAEKYWWMKDEDKKKFTPPKVLATY